MTQPPIKIDQLDQAELTVFVAGEFSTTSLTNLSDVTLSGPTSNQVLSFNGSVWVNSARTTGTELVKAGPSAPGITVAVGSPITTATVAVDTTVARRNQTNDFTIAVSGNATGGVVLTSAAPGYILHDTSGGSPDDRIWRMFSSNGNLNFDARSDDGLTTTNWLTVTRTGTTIDSITLNATSIILGGSPAFATFDSTSDVTKYKKDTTSRDTTETPTNDPDLAGWDLIADTFYEFEALLRVFSTSATPNFKMVFGFGSPQVLPVTSTYSFTSINTAATVIGDRVSHQSEKTTGIDASDQTILHLIGVIESNASTNGTFDFQWAQGTSDATAMSLSSGSWMRIKRLGPAT